MELSDFPITWKKKVVKIDDIKDLDKNPRKISLVEAARIRKSIKKFGIVDKFVINLDGTLIGGHQRKRIVEKLGLKEVEALVPSRMLTTAEVEELNIRLNKNTGSWDWDMLANEWNMDKLIDYGFKEEEFLGKREDLDAPLSELKQTLGKKDKKTVCPNCGIAF